MFTPARLEAYLRQMAALSHEVEEIGPFLLFFDPNDALRFFNYAKPARPFLSGEDPQGLGNALERLVAAFRERERLPRFEFVEEYAPGLPDILRSAGFVEEARQAFMMCGATAFRPVDPPLGVVMRTLHPDSPIEDLRAFVAVQRQGFAEDDAATASDAEAERLRPQLGADGRRDVVAWWGDEPVGAAGCTAILDGVSELVGVATPPRYRRRGIATALTAAVVEAQIAAGVQAVILTAQDEAAGRIYERVGFRPFGSALAYSIEN
jgi:GNAT superfamily N-acetyltransferase